MREPLNPYERYELTGISEEQRIAERLKKEDEYWDNYPDREDDDV